jgi:uncharacterized protein
MLHGVHDGHWIHPLSATQKGKRVMSEGHPPEHAPQMPDDRPEESQLIESTADDRLMALFAHIGALAGFFIPFAHIVVPLVIWLVKKDKSRFVDDQGKEALNFQLNVTVQAVILAIIGIVTCGIGLLLFLPWGIYVLIMCIIAGVKANSGVLYRYPATIRVLT